MSSSVGIINDIPNIWKNHVPNHQPDSMMNIDEWWHDHYFNMMIYFNTASLFLFWDFQ